jgi:CHAT domain-containing protein/tetratricopeptide (TPR) repeat protein
MSEAVLASLRQRLTRLACEGRFAEGISIQHTLIAELEALQAGASGPAALLAADDLQQARFYLDYLTFVAGLPRAAQWAMARAHRMNDLRERYDAAGHYASARRVAQLKLAIRRRWVGDNADTFYDVKILAECTQHAGDLAAAEALHREALVMGRRFFGHRPNVATVLVNLGTLLRARQELAEAEQLYQEAMAIRRERLGDKHPLTANCLNNLGNLYLDRGDARAAERAHREALSIRREVLGDEHPDVAASLNNLAVCLQVQGEHAAAEHLLGEAIAIRRRCFGEVHPLVARSLSNMGVVRHLRGDLAGAEREFRAAVDVHRQSLGPTHRESAESLANFAYHLLAREEFAAAETRFADWATVFESAWVTSGPGLAPAKALVSYFPGLAAARLHLGNGRGAWEAAERHLGRLLVEWMTSFSRESDAAMRREEQTVASLKARVSALENAAKSNGDGAGEAEVAAQSARDRLLEAEMRYAKAHASRTRQARLGHSGPLSCERVQAALDPHAAIVGWLDVESPFGSAESWGYVIRKRGQVVWVRLGGAAAGSPARPMQERAEKVRARLVAPGDNWRETYLPPAQALFRERLAPLVPALEGVEELIVIPSGAMLGVPVEALTDEAGTYVGDRYRVSYSPSAMLHAWLAERAAGKEAPGKEAPREMAALFVGDPPLTAPAASGSLLRSRPAIAELPRLGGSRQEITNLAPLFRRSTRLLGEDAAERRLLALAAASELGGYQVLHFATHALVDDEQPERSALVLSQVGLPDPIAAALADQRIETGLITAGDIAREFRLEAELVTLSACETGLGKAIGGEGYVGFMHAFFAAGARSQLVSLWNVDDQATQLLMRRFYENWLGAHPEPRGGRASGETMPKPAALREAKEWLRRYRTTWGEQPYEHPYYWAAFILFGAR